jgi:hypothetical protein
MVANFTPATWQARRLMRHRSPRPGDRSVALLPTVCYQRASTCTNGQLTTSMEQTRRALSNCYLAGIPDADRDRLLAQFRRRTVAATKALNAEVQKSIRSVRRDGYCAVSWQPGVLAVATPIVLDSLPVYALNMSMQDIEPTEALGSEIGEYLMAFAAKCKEVLCSQSNSVRNS